MTLSRFAATAALALSLSHPVLAQDEAAYRDANAAAIAAWQAMPLTLTNTTFITQPAGGYGLYQPRESAAFTPGEPIHLYTEPLGFGWQENEDGTLSFGLQIDLVLKDSDGTVLGEQEEFQRYVMTSQNRNREFFVSLTLDLSNAPPGAYILEYVVRDLAEEQSASLSLPFTLTGE